MYQPRHISKLESRHAKGLFWKSYLVQATPATPTSGLIEAAVRILKEDDLSGSFDPLHDTGFMIVHAGQDMDFVLYGFWVNVNELVIRVFKSLPGKSEALSRVDVNNASVACVWDLRIIGHEREAWIRHLLMPDAPAIEAYRVDQLVTLE